MAPLPHILLIAGFWEGTHVYDSLVHLLRNHNYSADVVPVISTGRKSPGNPSMKDDVAFIRQRIEEAVKGGGEQEVLLVLHSAGAFLGSMAIEGLSVKERQAKGQKGGVGKIVFLAGAIWPEGFMHGPLPFFEYEVCSISVWKNGVAGRMASLLLLGKWLVFLRPFPSPHSDPALANMM